MTDTSKSKVLRILIEEQHLRVITHPSGPVEYVAPLNILMHALLDSNLAKHKRVRLTFTGVPEDGEIKRGDMPVFLQQLLDSEVCGLDISLPRNADRKAWFHRPDQDNGPRRFVHIEKLYIRLPQKPKNQSPNEPEDQSPDEPKDQSPNEPKDQSPKVSLEEVTQLLKHSLAPENRFPNLEELRIYGLDEDSIRKAEADASIGCSLFMDLIYAPYRPQDRNWCPKSKQGPPGQPSPYHVATSRDLEDDSEDGIVIKWEKEKPKESSMLPQVPESNTGGPP